jgi:hypothetical protein
MLRRGAPVSGLPGKALAAARRRGGLRKRPRSTPKDCRDLIVLGWLRDGERTDRQAVRDAFVRFARSTLGHA